MLKKSVMISIQPYWVFMIIARTMGWNIDKEKIVEVRKTFPKDKNWNKVVKIYCSKDKNSFAKIPLQYQPLMEQFSGKVIGEFVCDNIVIAELGSYCNIPINESCLDALDLIDYANDKTVYGWHISDLVIYDKPKELSEFWNADKCPYASQDGCTYKFYCYRAGQTKRCGSTLARPPQSWCYVEGAE